AAGGAGVDLRVLERRAGVTGPLVEPGGADPAHRPVAAGHELDAAAAAAGRALGGQDPLGVDVRRAGVGRDVRLADGLVLGVEVVDGVVVQLEQVALLHV